MIITPYKPHPYFSIKAGIILLLGSIFLGAVIGCLAYYISMYFYLLIVFPIIVSFIPVKLFDNVQKISGTNSKIAMVAASGVAAVCCSLAFNLLWYNNYQEDFISDVQETYQLSPEEAEQAIEEYNFEETGQHGFIAYEILSANLGVEYVNSFSFRSITLFNFVVPLQGVTYWLYTLVETLLFGFGILWSSLKRCVEPYSLRAKNWYDEFVNCIGALPEGDKTLFLSYLNSSRLEDAKQLIVPEGDLSHPKIEVYQNLAKGAQGDSLITLKSTSMEGGKVKRKITHQFEVLSQESLYSIPVD